MDTYTYNETLTIVESFMVDSGIRDYCTKICKGACCKECYTAEYACHKNEGRRLSCSTFICAELINIIFKHTTSRTKYLHVLDSIRHCLYDVMGCVNVFYTVHTKVIQESFRIPKKYTTPVKKIDVEDIKLRISSITEPVRT